MKSVLLSIGIITFIGLSYCLAESAEKTETSVIEALIAHVESLDKVVFIRNETEYDAQAAARFLRLKWSMAGEAIDTAASFVEKVASFSSTTGKPYLMRFPDGKVMASRDYLLGELSRTKGMRQSQ